MLHEGLSLGARDGAFKSTKVRGHVWLCRGTFRSSLPALRAHYGFAINSNGWKTIVWNARTLLTSNDYLRSILWKEKVRKSKEKRTLNAVLLTTREGIPCTRDILREYEICFFLTITFNVLFTPLMKLYAARNWFHNFSIVWKGSVSHFNFLLIWYQELVWKNSLDKVEIIFK